MLISKASSCSLTVSGDRTVVARQSTGSKPWAATSSTVSLSSCRNALPALVASKVSDLIVIKSAGRSEIVITVAPSERPRGIKSPPVRVKLLPPVQLDLIVIPVKLKVEVLIGSLKVRVSSSACKSRLNPVSSGGVVSGV